MRHARRVDYLWKGRTFCKVYACPSETAAVVRQTELIAQRVGREGYKRLGPGRKIAKTAESHPSGERK